MRAADGQSEWNHPLRRPRKRAQTITAEYGLCKEARDQSWLWWSFRRSKHLRYWWKYSGKLKQPQDWERKASRTWRRGTCLSAINTSRLKRQKQRFNRQELWPYLWMPKESSSALVLPACDGDIRRTVNLVESTSSPTHLAHQVQIRHLRRWRILLLSSVQPKINHNGETTNVS